MSSAAADPSQVSLAVPPAVDPYPLPVDCPNCTNHYRAPCQPAPGTHDPLRLPCGHIACRNCVSSRYALLFLLLNTCVLLIYCVKRMAGGGGQHWVLAAADCSRSCASRPPHPQGRYGSSAVPLL